MFEMSVDLYVIATHFTMQLNLLGFMNVGDTEHVFEG
jgi:hypothetical protein